MKHKYIHVAVISLVLGLSSVVSAHAGHGNGSDSSSLIHYFTEPLHLGIGVVVIGFIGLTIYKLKQSRLKMVKEK